MRNIPCLTWTDANGNLVAFEDRVYVQICNYRISVNGVRQLKVNGVWVNL